MLVKPIIELEALRTAEFQPSRPEPYLRRMAKTDGDKVAIEAHKEFVGHQIGLAIKALGTNQSKVASDYGLSGTNRLNQWIKGLYYPDPYFLKRFCDDTGFTTDFFYRGLRGGVSSARVDDLRAADAASSGASPEEVRQEP